MPTIGFNDQNPSPVLTIIIYLFAIVGVGATVYFGGNLLTTLLNPNARAGLNVEVLNGSADVFINDEKVGTTPFESTNLKPGENTIKIQQGTRVYQTGITFIKDAEKIPFVDLKRDLGVSDIFSSGQTAWYDQNDIPTVLSIISEPPEAAVFIDGTEVGKTPFSSDALTDGEYDLKVSLEGYEAHTSRIIVQTGYRLNLAVKLFPTPVLPKLSLFDGSTNLYNNTLDNTFVSADPDTWVRAILYWNITRGINLNGSGEEGGIKKEPVFDFFLDYRGDIYTADGNVIVSPEGLELIKNAKKGVYLGRISDGAGLTSAARDNYEKLMSGAGEDVDLDAISSATGKKATVGGTPMGWVNVRKAPVSGSVIKQINDGESYSVLEEKSGWVKIKLSNDQAGWVSGVYVKVQ